MRRRSVALRLCPYLGASGAERLSHVCQRLESMHRRGGQAPSGPASDAAATDWLHYGEAYAAARHVAFDPPPSASFFTVDAESGCYLPTGLGRTPAIGGRCARMA